MTNFLTIAKHILINLTISFDHEIVYVKAHPCNKKGHFSFVMPGKVFPDIMGMYGYPGSLELRNFYHLQF
jgi:hypothetical protein